MRISSSSLLTIWALLSTAACSAAVAAPPPAGNAESQGSLKAAAAAHRTLAAQFSAVPHDDLRHCQTTSGDCLISVADRRDQLVRHDYLNACRDPDPDKQGPCVVHELEQSGNDLDLASYYELENWCSRKLLECTSALASDAAERSRRQSSNARRTQIESARSAAAAASAPAFAEEKAAFVRSSLPPKGQEGCPVTDPDGCTNALKGPSDQYEAELAKATESYDAERALRAYTALQQARADCYAPELACLRAALPAYGGTAESEQLLEQSLTLLGRQQQLKTNVDPDEAEGCRSANVLQHSDGIVAAYQTYAKDPAPASFVRLQKAFVALHTAELNCLSHLHKLKQN